MGDQHKEVLQDSAGLDVPVTGQVPDVPGLVSWVAQIAALTRPAAIHYCDGSDAEYDQLVDLLVANGSAIQLDEQRRPHSLYVRTDPDDVARVEDSTFICSVNEADAGPLNNWMAPDQMKQIMLKLYEGSMQGRTMYVVPFCMGSVQAKHAKFGVELTDSPYVVISMKVMTRMGSHVVEELQKREGDFVKCLHSVGAPLKPGQKDVFWPCNQTKYITHFPEELAIWSFGSGYGGNSLLGKKCYALRIASVMARDEGWLAEHMLLLKLTSPEGKVHYVTAAFPSACGKTNLAMLQPTIPGWKAETIGDDIVWMRFGQDGRLYAINPEFGFFGVAAGTSERTNPIAMRTIAAGNTVFTNTALTPDGDVWWQDLTEELPEHLIDWKGRNWTRENGPDGGQPGEPPAHPNGRFTVPLAQCPTLAPEWQDPQGVPVDIVIFGGRRRNTIPLVTQSRDWRHGVFMGSVMSSETTAAAKGAVGVLRRDPMAMRPFIGYHVADYLQHWLDIGAQADASKLPKIFYVNWFRKSAEGKFLWPGFGENSRVLKWMVERLEGKVGAVETPFGFVPKPGDLDTNGLTISPEALNEVTSFVPSEWDEEYPKLAEWLESMGPKLPKELTDELEHMRTMQ